MGKSERKKRNEKKGSGFEGRACERRLQVPTREHSILPIYTEANCEKKVPGGNKGTEKEKKEKKEPEI